MSQNQERRYYIRLQLRGAPTTRTNPRTGYERPVWPSAVWPILFPSKEFAQAHIDYVGSKLFASDGSDYSQKPHKKGRFKGATIEICKRNRRKGVAA